MALKYRKPGQTIPTRSVPLTPPGTGAAGKWIGYLAMLIGIVLTVVAWFAPNPVLQIAVVVVLAALLVGVVVTSVRALRTTAGSSELPIQVWLLLAAALVVAASLGVAVALWLN
ncbi:MAG: hypothetical protein RMK84_11575 [Oscillochloridaceae bacterium]|nr:hypothetical protein [Chloroflexaceae bacterium]MDW8390755.1 hypothetical protein [Oscillochloridaceae bacterium]